jgi:hypothetical protein
MRLLTRCLPLLTVAAASWVSGAAHAGSAYGSLGFPGITLGYAQSIDERVTLRGDFATLGSYDKTQNYEGIDYKASGKLSRVGLFADYFPTGSGLRLTGGITLNTAELKLRSDFKNGDVVTVGNMPVAMTSSDFFNVTIDFPKTTPYLGLGWGLRDQDKGWGFVADVGASIGKAKVVVDTNLTNRGVTQADIDRETQELRDGVGKIKFLPQISLGISYRY